MALKPHALPQDLPLTEALYRIDLTFDQLYAQGVRFGGGKGQGLIAGLGGNEVVFDGITPQVAIPHMLGVVPQGAIVLNQSGSETIKGRPTAADVVGQTDDWTATNIYLVSTIAQKALIFIVR